VEFTTFWPNSTKIDKNTPKLMFLFIRGEMGKITKKWGHYIMTSLECYKGKAFGHLNTSSCAFDLGSFGT